MHHRFILNRRTLHHNIFLGQKFADPVNGKKFRKGDEIVFCAHCSKAFLYKSWKRLGNRHCNQSKTLKKFPSTFTPKKAAKSSGVSVAKRNGGVPVQILDQKKKDSVMLRAMWIAIAVLLLFVIGFTLKMDRASQPDLRSELSHIEVPKPTSGHASKNSQPAKIKEGQVGEIGKDEISENDVDSVKIQVEKGEGKNVEEKMNEKTDASQTIRYKKSASSSKGTVYSTRDYEDIDFESLGFSKEELEGLFQSSGIKEEKTIKAQPDYVGVDQKEANEPAKDSESAKQEGRLQKPIRQSEVLVKENIEVSAEKNQSSIPKVASNTPARLEKANLKTKPQGSTNSSHESIGKSSIQDDATAGIKKFMELISSSQVDFDLKKEYQLEMIQTYFSDKLAEVLIEKNGVVVGSMDIYSLTNKLMTSPSLGVRKFSYQKNEDEKIYQFIVDTSIKKDHTWN